MNHSLEKREASRDVNIKNTLKQERIVQEEIEKYRSAVELETSEVKATAFENCKT